MMNSPQNQEFPKICVPEIPVPEILAGTAVAVGIDLESVERVKTAIERSGNAFLERVFVPAEIEYCRSRNQKSWESFAARWAAKEAFSKAAGTGIGAEFGFLDFAVLSGENGVPVTKISPAGTRILQKIGAKNALVSLSHSHGFAAAIVIFTQ